MPNGLLLFALVVLLVALTILALSYGLIGVAGVCLGALLTTAVTLRDRSRSRATGLHDVAWRAVRAEAGRLLDNGVLVALVYPEERPYLAALVTEARSYSKVLVVLAIGHVADAPRAASGALCRGVVSARREPDPVLLDTLASATRVAGRPVTLMQTFGTDPAHAALEIARLIRPSRLVVLRASGTSAAEQQRRANLVWESLCRPRPAVRVQMVSTRDEATHSFELAAAPPRDAASNGNDSP